MKIIRNEPDTLILEQRPVFIGLLIAMLIVVFAGVGFASFRAGDVIGGLMFIIGGAGLGGLCFWAFVRKTQLWLDRRSRRFALRERSVSRMTETTGELGDIKEAILQTSRGSKGSVTRRAALRCVGKTNRIIPLTGAYTSGSGPQRAAHAVNDWLAQNTAQRQRPARQDSAQD